MCTPIIVDLTKPEYCCVPTTFVGMNPPKGFTDALLTLQQARNSDDEFRVTITLFDGTNEIGAYIINHQHVKYPSGQKWTVVIKSEMLVADTVNHLRMVVLAELLASSSTLTISRDDSGTKVHLQSDFLKVDIHDDVPPMYLRNFIPPARQ